MLVFDPTTSDDTLFSAVQPQPGALQIRGVNPYPFFQTQYEYLTGGYDGPGLVQRGGGTPSGGCGGFCGLDSPSAAAPARPSITRDAGTWGPPVAVLTLGAGALLLMRAIAMARGG